MTTDFRRLFAGIAFGALAHGTAWAHGAHGGSAQLQTHNNDRAIAAQVYGGLHADSGEVRITFYGNIAFEIESPRGVKVFVDPWRNDITGMYPPWYVRDMPIVRTDIGLVTHAHFDHDAVDRLAADMVMERMAGVFKLADVRITGIAEKHVCETQGEVPYRAAVKAMIDQDPCPPNETLQWDNSLYVIETGGLRILHWGDNRQNPPDHVWDMVGDIDVAILAVSDDGRLLAAPDEIARRPGAEDEPEGVDQNGLPRPRFSREEVEPRGEVHFEAIDDRHVADSHPAEHGITYTTAPFRRRQVPPAIQVSLTAYNPSW